MDDKRFLNVNDVSVYRGIPIPMVYKIIRKMNDELSAWGCITDSDQMSRRYFGHGAFGSLNAGKEGV